MNKSDAVAAVVRTCADQPIVFTTGYASRIARGIADRPNHFYMTGSMGLAASIGIGLAAHTARPAVVVDGDGSLLMNPVNLIVAGGMPDLKLLHVVLDDGRYASTGGQLTFSGNAHIPAMAAAAGYRTCRTAASAEKLGDLLREHAQPTGPTLIYCAIDADGAAPPPRIDVGLGEVAERFREFVVNSSDSRLAVGEQGSQRA